MSSRFKSRRRTPGELSLNSWTRCRTKSPGWPRSEEQTRWVNGHGGDICWARGSSPSLDVALAFIVLEVFAIVAAQEVYQEYAKAIQDTAEGAAQYYQEIISAYSEQEEAPPEKA